jgi:hypothetical protein
VNDILHTVGAGLSLGFLATVVGWAKSAKPGRFSVRRLLYKMPAGLVVGVVAAWYKLPFDDAMLWAAGLGLVEAVDNLSKMALRRIFPSFAYFDETDSGAAEAAADKVAKEITLLAGGSDRARIIALTEAFRDVYKKFLDIGNPTDRLLYDHLSYLTNQIVIKISKNGWTDESFVDAGKGLFRLFQIYRKHRSSNVELTEQKWNAEMQIVIETMQGVFSGKVNPLKI